MMGCRPWRRGPVVTRAVLRLCPRQDALDGSHEDPSITPPPPPALDGEATQEERQQASAADATATEAAGQGGSRSSASNGGDMGQTALLRTVVGSPRAPSPLPDDPATTLSTLAMSKVR